MKTVAMILRAKGSEVHAVPPDATVFEALGRMAERDIGALLVTEGGKPVGIFSERDYARKVVLQGKFSRDTLVREIMTSKVVFVRPDQTVEECMALMASRRFRHLPVLEGDAVVGLISIGDVVSAVISEQEFMIDQLVNYIGGR